MPEYDTYRYIEAPPAPVAPVVGVRKEVRYLEDNPRRSVGGIVGGKGVVRERERERERVVVDNGGRRRREYFK